LDVQLNSVSEPVGTLDVALGHAARLLQRDAALAAEQAGEILKAVPGHPRARLILGAAHRIGGRTQLALDVLEPLAVEHPRSAPAHLELAMARSAAGRRDEAVASLRLATQLKPDSADAWRLLADELDAAGDSPGADQARARYLKSATHDPRLVDAAAALVANDLPLADARLRAHLERFPTDVAALRMLAEVAGRLRRYLDAQTLLEKCLELSPSFDAARNNYAVVLNLQGKAEAALCQVDLLLAKEPGNPGYRNLKAAVLANLSEFAGSIEVYEAVLKDFPRQPKIWMSYGHSLKTARRQDDSVSAYRRAIAMQPTLGEAYWSLSNLKTFKFTDDDITAHRQALQRQDLSEIDRLHFEFSLGKALEDTGCYAESFEHYSKGNAIGRTLHPYSSEENTRFMRHSKALFTSDFFASRAGAGSPDPAPIFIVGLPRAGSTLIEQILASHSQVEGTMELPNIPQIARELLGKHGDAPRIAEAPFFAALDALTPDELRALGDHYLSTTRVHRKTRKPFFIDKMPNNCAYVGLIHLILPNAKIIDARRHPLGCCFSGFKQHFARGQSFSYGLGDIGNYYRDYVELMAHIDAVLPGRVHRVHYESMVMDTEAEVRRVLDYCGLLFEDGCLKFYENERAVRTASSEQVRQPIFIDGMDHWKHFEPWLGALKQALGTVLDQYPAVPQFAST
jgi:tetratricopeptide (TPR) repeat protein